MSENILEEKKATDEYMLQALQTASCFAENVVKKLWCATLRKSSIELFGEEIPEISGEINIDAKPGSGMQSYALKLDIVSSTYRINVEQFKNIPVAYKEMIRLMTAVEIYWEYCKTNYKLPKLYLWKTLHGTLHVGGAPEDASHIGVIVKNK
jgi:hypothetical protein